MYTNALTILLALLALLLLIRGERRAIDPNYGILTASVGMPRVLSDRRTRDLIVLDLDNFKAFNQRHGHTEADRRVRLALRLRKLDGCQVVKRGGDELIVSCPAGSGDRIALLLRERLAHQGLTATIVLAHRVIAAGPVLPGLETAILAAKAAGTKNTIIVLSS